MLEKYKRALIAVAESLISHDVDFVLVGSAILPLIYGVQYDPKDVDIFVVNKSTIMDNELFENIAKERDWDIGTTEHGTIYYELIIGGESVRVDLVENILDIYIPPQIFNNVIYKDLNNIKIKSIRLEDLLVLKARAATKDAEVFINEMARMISDVMSNITIDKGYIRSIVEYFPQDERESILNRLMKNGIYVL